MRALCKPDGADAVIEVCGVPDVIPLGLQLLRVGGRYVLGGLVNPDANVTIDANMLVKRWVTMRGIHNYHPRHLDSGARFCHGEPQAVSLQGHCRFQICAQGSRQRLQEGFRAQRAARRDRALSMQTPRAQLHAARPLHRRRMGRACRGQELRLDQPVQHGQARGRAGRLRGGCRSRRHGGEGRFPRMVARVDQGARALSNAARRARSRSTPTSSP